MSQTHIPFPLIMYTSLTTISLLIVRGTMTMMHLLRDIIVLLNLYPFFRFFCSPPSLPPVFYFPLCFLQSPIFIVSAFLFIICLFNHFSSSVSYYIYHDLSLSLALSLSLSMTMTMTMTSTLLRTFPSLLLSSPILPIILNCITPPVFPVAI